MAGYDVYLGNTLLPIAPEKISMKINGKNTTYNLINDGEMNILKLAGLTTVNFTILLPAVKYPFATYLNGFKAPSHYLTLLEELKQSRKAFQFIVTRHGNIAGRVNLHNTNMTVSVEDYTVIDDAGEGFDTKVEINLKQFKEFKTKTFYVENPSPTAPIAIEEERPESTAPASGKKTYTATVHYSGSSGATGSVSATSTVSYQDALNKAYKKVPKNAQWASTKKQQATNQSPPLTDKALEAARKRVAESQKSNTSTSTTKKPTTTSGNSSQKKLNRLR